MFKYRYKEDESMKKVMDYINGTYGQHYVGNGGIQTIDVWETMDIATEMCQGTAVKYLMRFGKKEGYNEKDLMKAVHYIILLMNFVNKQESEEG